jgi:predicted phage terminase large subunit-like protein
MQDPERKKLQKIAYLAENDLFYFCKHVLGYSKMEVMPHQELCTFITNKRTGKGKKKMVLLPRGSFKSSLLTIGYSLWRIIKDPNVRILINSETFSQAKAFLAGIKQHIEQNETFRMLYGDLKSGENTWKQEEITVNSRTATIYKEPTIATAGIGVTKVGQHYDVIIFDDIVSTKNVNTREQIQKVHTHYKLMLSILEPKGDFYIVGTRYHFNDLYGHILEHESVAYDIMVRSAINDDNTLFFPSVLTKEYLEQQRASQGSEHFSNQYLNKVIDENASVFRLTWIKYYDEAPKNLNHFMLMDNASSQEQDADFTAIVICGIDPGNNIYVREALAIKDTLAPIINTVFMKMQEYKISEQGCLALEVNAMQLTLKYILTEEMEKRGEYFSIKELRPNSTRSKMSRIKGLQPWFENGKIFLQKSQTELIEQIIHYPRCKHDDLIDAFASVLEVMSAPKELARPIWEGSTLTENEQIIWQNKRNLTKRSVIRKKRMMF